LQVGHFYVIKITLSPFQSWGRLRGTCTQGCAVAFSASLAAGLDYAGLSGQAFDAFPLYVTFDCCSKKLCPCIVDCGRLSGEGLA
ncbi:MAG TPA: hypothetical protein VMW38_27520, partial [Terriglobia bacterium]|nr:hypothetical protein [Terriglobia bacterium]